MALASASSDGKAAPPRKSLSCQVLRALEDPRTPMKDEQKPAAPSDDGEQTALALTDVATPPASSRRASPSPSPSEITKHSEKHQSKDEFSKARIKPPAHWMHVLQTTDILGRIQIYKCN